MFGLLHRERNCSWASLTGVIKLKNLRVVEARYAFIHLFLAAISSLQVWFAENMELFIFAIGWARLLAKIRLMPLLDLFLPGKPLRGKLCRRSWTAAIFTPFRLDVLFSWRWLEENNRRHWIDEDEGTFSTCDAGCRVRTNRYGSRRYRHNHLGKCSAKHADSKYRYCRWFSSGSCCCRYVNRSHCNDLRSRVNTSYLPRRWPDNSRISDITRWMGDQRYRSLFFQPERDSECKSDTRSLVG